MQNWKDYVGFQPIDTKIENFVGAKVFVLVFDPSYKAELKSFCIPHDQYKYTADEIGSIVEEAIKSFPTLNANLNLNQDSSLGTEEFIRLKKKRIENKIAANNRRGAGNTWFEDCVFYSGITAFDNPIIVSEYNGLYAIFLHPNFDKYGFRLI